MGVEHRVSRAASVGSNLKRAAKAVRESGVDVTIAADRKSSRAAVPRPIPTARRVITEALDAAVAAGASAIELGAAAWDGGLVITVVDNGEARASVERLLETESTGVATVGSYRHRGKTVWAVEYRWTPSVLPRTVDPVTNGILLDPGVLSAARRAAGQAAD